MSISISFWSKTEGEIKRFLSRFYEYEYNIQDDCRHWITEFHDPLESVDIISSLMDNEDQYNISMYLHMQDGILYKIDKNNYNDVIKGFYILFYKQVI
jgi:predicted transcriptional regulator